MKAVNNNKRSQTSLDIKMSVREALELRDMLEMGVETIIKEDLSSYRNSISCDNADKEDSEFLNRMTIKIMNPEREEE